MEQPFEIYLNSQTTTQLLDLLYYITNIDEIRTNHTKVLEPELKEMFQKYNEIYKENEIGIHCSSCCSNIAKRLSNLKFEILKVLEIKWDAMRKEYKSKNRN